MLDSMKQGYKVTTRYIYKELHVKKVEGCMGLKDRNKVQHAGKERR